MYFNYPYTLASKEGEVFTMIRNGLYGIDRFFLKEIKNVMFLNKIDAPYCLVVFFVV